MLSRHKLDPVHKAAVHALQHATTLRGATVPAATSSSMTDRVCNQKIRVCTFIAEHDLSFPISQPRVSLFKKLAEGTTGLTKLSISNQHASYMNTHGIAPEFIFSIYLFPTVLFPII